MKYLWYLPSWSRVFLGKLTVANLSKKCIIIIEPRYFHDQKYQSLENIFFKINPFNTCQFYLLEIHFNASLSTFMLFKFSLQISQVILCVHPSIIPSLIGIEPFLSSLI